jgi:hypothetical protein
VIKEGRTTAVGESADEEGDGRRRERERERNEPDGRPRGGGVSFLSQ